jgi:hypothetical protein
MIEADSDSKPSPDAPESPPKAASKRQRVVDWLLYRRRVPDLTQQIEEHPEAVLADFTHADPLQRFDLKDVAFTYGSRWKQRYFTKNWR